MTALLEHVSVFAALSVFIGYLVFGLTGFGSALVIIPLLSWQWPLSAIVPLVLLLDIAASLLHTGFNLRQVQWRLIPILVPFAIAGAWAGAWLHRWSDSPVLLALLGAYICWIALQSMRRQPIARMPASLPASAAAGTVMGLIETLLGTAGPVVMAWLTGQIRSAEGTRATAPVIILIMVCEPPRVLRRLNHLRGLSHDEVKQVFTGGPRAGGADGAGASRRVPVAVGCH